MGRGTDSEEKQPIFGSATSLFIGHSPTLGMLPPHASWPPQISGCAIPGYL